MKRNKKLDNWLKVIFFTLAGCTEVFAILSIFIYEDWVDNLFFVCSFPTLIMSVIWGCLSEMTAKATYKKAKQVLHKQTEWIVNEVNEDVCHICANYARCPLENAPEDYPDDEEPCPFRRADGADACKSGIIEHFISEVEKNEKSKK